MVVSEQRRSATPVLGEATVQDFREVLRGSLVRPGDPDYDQARKVFNGMIDRRPALIARCADAADVAAAIQFARGNGLVVSVRSGGHGVAGHAVVDDGLVIDLSPMKAVEVDAQRRIARAGAGLRLGELIVATERYGLVTPTGTVSDTGVGGLTTGGGYGYLSGKYGMAVDNVVGAEVVTADGRIVRASADEHPDLFWAIRGGSGNFGVVTTFELALHPVPQVLGGMLIYPGPMAGEVLRFYREVAAAAPDELTVYAALVTAPDGRQAVAVMACYSGDIAEGEQVLAPIRAFGSPVADLIRPMPYSTMNTLIDDANPSGLLNYWKWNGLRELSEEAIDTVVDFVARVPSPRTVVLIDQLHGAARRVSPTATAFAHRDAPHGLVVLSMWSHPEESERNIAWTRELAAATAPYATGGAHVNGVVEDRPRAAFGVNYDRLVKVKNAYDPTNVFRHNQNIKPTVDAA